MGTWKLAVLPLENPDHLYFVKNSGSLLVGKTERSAVVTTEDAFFSSHEA